MKPIDVLARIAAITVLIFLMALIFLRFASVVWPDLSPLALSLFFTLLSVSSAGLPLLVIHLVRVAMGGSIDDAGRARYFFVFTLLTSFFAMLFAWLLAFGHVGL